MFRASRRHRPKPEQRGFGRAAGAEPGSCDRLQVHQEAAGIVFEDTASALFGAEGLRVTDVQAGPGRRVGSMDGLRLPGRGGVPGLAAASPLNTSPTCRRVVAINSKSPSGTSGPRPNLSCARFSLIGGPGYGA
jgi:hypothetical protein